MRKILRLDVLSVARLFAIFYAVSGLYISANAILTEADKLGSPFGFDYPYVYFHVNLNFVLREWPVWAVPFLYLISVVIYAITGAISGATAAFAYNLTSRFWPGIAAKVEPEKIQAEPALQTPVTPPADPPSPVSPTC